MILQAMVFKSVKVKRPKWKCCFHTPLKEEMLIPVDCDVTYTCLNTQGNHWKTIQGDTLKNTINNPQEDKTRITEEQESEETNREQINWQTNFIYI